MPASSPRISQIVAKKLRTLGQQIRARRKQLGVSASSTAEAAGMSRVTLHRIERGEASVAMGAYLSAISALGLELELNEAGGRGGRSRRPKPGLPAKIRLSDYPQLKRLGWQLKSSQQISPKEALEIYERNWRHVDLKAMSPRERELVQALLATFGRERLLV